MNRDSPEVLPEDLSLPALESDVCELHLPERLESVLHGVQLARDNRVTALA